MKKYSKYDVTLDMIDIVDNPGCWVELQRDSQTDIWERNGARYFVTLNNVIIDINTGKQILQDEIEEVTKSNASNKEYRWVYVYKADNLLL